MHYVSSYNNIIPAVHSHSDRVSFRAQHSEYVMYSTVMWLELGNALHFIVPKHLSLVDSESNGTVCEWLDILSTEQLNYTCSLLELLHH